MRILIVCQHFWPENFRINEMCQDFIKQGHDVDVLCGIPNYPKGKFFSGYSYFKPRREIYDGASIFRVGEIPQNKKLGSLAIILNYFFFPFASLFTLPALMKRPHDLVFLYSLTPIFMSWPGLLLARKKKIPAVMYVLDYWPDSLFSVIKFKSKFFRSFFAKISRWHYKRTDRIITPSQGMIDKFVEDYGISRDKLGFIPQSCDPVYEKTVSSEELHKLYDGRINFVFAGNIGPAQSLETLVQAVSLLGKNPSAPQFRFIIVGDGMSRISVESEIDRLSLRDYFSFVGFQPVETVLLYQELADVLFVSLSDEPLFDIMIPAKVQSYMAAGKPILAALNGEGAEIVEASGSGLVCPAMSPDKLADKILEFLHQDKKSLYEMGNKARLFYQTNYSHDIISNQWNQLIQDCFYTKSPDTEANNV